MQRFLLVLICLFMSFELAYAIDYSKFDMNDTKSINKLIKVFKKEYKNKKGTNIADNEFKKFYIFYMNFAELQNKKFEIMYPKNFHYDYVQANKVYKKIKKHGLIIMRSEDYYYLAISNKYLYDNFAEYVTEPKKDLLEFMVLFDTPISQGDIYVISKLELENIIYFYEKFQQKYPQYSKENNIQNLINNYKEDLKHYPYLVY